MADPIFCAALNYEYGETVIKKAEQEIAVASKELLDLAQLSSTPIQGESSSWLTAFNSTNVVRARVNVLLARMKESEDVLEKAEREKLRLKKVFKDEV